VNGAAFVSNYSCHMQSYGAGYSRYTWNHNLGYKPVLMLSVDGTGGSESEHITYSYENISNNTTLIYAYNNSINVYTLSDFRIRWIIVGQQ
jgi:hypothetical protein